MPSIRTLNGNGRILTNTQFLLVSTTNFFLFLMLATWSFLPLFVVELGGSKADTGLVMGSIGLTTLGSIPFLTPLMDKYGRKPFILVGMLATGLSNTAFMLFHEYSHLMILVRLTQGISFAAAFNGCSTAVVDLIPPEYRAQGIGFFGVSSSLAFSVGPFVAESVLIEIGFDAFFLLLTIFGLIGFALAFFINEPNTSKGVDGAKDFFPTAVRDGYITMMAIALIFGAGFAAMNVYFPLYAKTMGLRAGPFFTAFGVSLLLVRLLLGEIAANINPERIVFVCLIGYGLMLALTALMGAMWHTIALGAMLGALQGIAYPVMMARMVNQARDDNRAVVVGLFTGSFGLGINSSTLFWGFVAEYKGLEFMYFLGAGLLIGVALLSIITGRSTA